MVYVLERPSISEQRIAAGDSVYDRDGYRVGLVEDILAESDALRVRRAGFGLGTLGGEYLLPFRLVAGATANGITLTVATSELSAFG